MRLIVPGGGEGGLGIAQHRAGAGDEHVDAEAVVVGHVVAEEHVAGHLADVRVLVARQQLQPSSLPARVRRCGPVPLRSTRS
jgi:hypothetical protein